MAIREVREIGDPILEKACKEVKEVTDRTKELINDMFETMYETNGVGLAAPQVGILKRIVVIDCTGEDLMVMINPKIIEMSGEQTGGEGCLSVNREVEGIVPRYARVTFTGFDLDGKPVKYRAREELSIAFQHEMDHLNGILFIDHIDPENPYKNKDYMREI